MAGSSFALLAILASLPAGLILALRFNFKEIYMGYILFIYLFLPQASLDVPFFIPVSKIGIIGIFSIILIAFYFKDFKLRRKHHIILIFIISFSSVIISSFYNGDVIVSNSGISYEFSFYDGVSAAFKWMLRAVPFLVAVGLFHEERDFEKFLKLMVFFGVIYGILICFEVRMSPQLHNWIYGFFPHEFFQHVRDGGFRPIVFLPHALHVAFFAFIAACSLIVLLRARLIENNFFTKATLAFLTLSVVLCKSLGSILFLIVCAPFIWLSSRRLLRTAALIFAVIAITYPASRSLGFFPTESVLKIMSSIDEERTQSLETRFNQEGPLLEHALERPIWGWGGNGRYRRVNTEGPVITDGFWVVIFGERGWVGFLSIFGLLFYPIFLIWRMGRRRETPFAVAGVALLLAVNMIELLPNSSSGPWTWFMAGMLTGYALSRKEEAEGAKPRANSEALGGPRPRTVI